MDPQLGGVGRREVGLREIDAETVASVADTRLQQVVARDVGVAGRAKLLAYAHHHLEMRRRHLGVVSPASNKAGVHGLKISHERHLTSTPLSVCSAFRT